MQIWKTLNGITIYRIKSGKVNCFLIVHDNVVLLVDTGYKSDRNKLLREIRKIANPNFIVQSHTHFDHCSNTAFLKDHFESSVIVHSSEAEFLEKGLSPLPKGTMFLTKAIIRLANWMDNPVGPFEKLSPDILVDQVH